MARHLALPVYGHQNGPPPCRPLQQASLPFAIFSPDPVVSASSAPPHLSDEFVVFVLSLRMRRMPEYVMHPT